MKTLWINVTPFDKDKAIAALESGAQAVVVPAGESETVRAYGRILTVAPDGDLRPGEQVEFMDIAGKADEDAAARVPTDKTVVLRMRDWTVIPIENLLARRAGPLLVQVKNAEQARLMVEILEKGVDGVLLDPPDVNEIKRTAEWLRGIGESLPLTEATVTAVKQLGMGDRCCLDTCTQMSLGQGILVGNTASGFFLVHSESMDNPYVAARPFRVNAGAVHAYTLTPGGKTAYLADLKAGDALMIVGADSKTQPAWLGRNKIEKRPMLLIEAEADGRHVGLVLQNAETIRLVAPDGRPVSVKDLAVGDRVLARIEAAARHFGMQVEETLVEQ